MQDDEPELAGYDPGDDRPLRSRRMVITLRIVVIVGLVALVLPGIITTMMVGANSAEESCQRWVDYEDPTSPGSHATFELLGAHGLGWQCYTQGAFGGDSFVASLGIIPGQPNIPAQQLVTN
jgi:hypothetical protein